MTTPPADARPHALPPPLTEKEYQCIAASRPWSVNDFRGVKRLWFSNRHFAAALLNGAPTPREQQLEELLRETIKFLPACDWHKGSEEHAAYLRSRIEVFFGYVPLAYPEALESLLEGRRQFIANYEQEHPEHASPAA